MKYLKLFIFSILSVALFSGFWSGKDDNQLKHERLEANKQSLSALYKYDPSAQNMIRNAYGYATFSNLGINLVLLSAEGGKGVAHNNTTGQNIYMNMASGGVGFGLGVKDFKIIFIFENKKVFDHFIDHGWEANAQADAAAKAGSDGGALNLAITVEPGVRLYKLTQDGLALQATIQGTKYWRDKDLN